MLSVHSSDSSLTKSRPEESRVKMVGALASKANLLDSEHATKKTLSALKQAFKWLSVAFEE